MKNRIKSLLHRMGVPRYLFHFFSASRFLLIDFPKLAAYAAADKMFLFLEKRTKAYRYQVAYGPALHRIPYFLHRRGGDAWYGQWAYRIGLWYGIMHRFFYPRQDAVIVDVGCATGIGAISAEPFVREGGRYVGIDIDPVNIDFCRRHYDAPHFSFIHHPVHNAMYEDTQPRAFLPWPIADASADAVLALSVWTHLNEEDARFYFKEVARIMRPGGYAFVTFLVLDRAYEAACAAGIPDFPFKRLSEPMSGSGHWRSVSGYGIPEFAVGIMEEGIAAMLRDTGLSLRESVPGFWKGGLGLSGQDLLIFEKK